MANTVYIHCTGTNHHKYKIYAKSIKGEPVSRIAKDANGKDLVFRVLGGANNANRALVTVNGVVTELEKDDVELLRKECELFRIHEANGFITVKDFHRLDTSDMEAKDKSAQLTSKDFKKKGLKAPKTAAEANASSPEDGE